MIHIEGLEKTRGDFHFGPFDLRVEAGAIVGILGREGSGRTTLLRLMWGFERPDAGRVEIFGMQPHLHQLRVRARAGYAPEITWNYPDLLVGHFLNFIGDFYDKWDKTHIYSLLRRFDIDWGQHIGTLSLTQRRQLTTIAALGHHPSLVLLDQPAKDMKDKERSQLLDFLRRLSREEKVTLVITGDVAEDLDRIADGVLTLNHGRILECAR
ncbi:MAG TPA: ABC transporter ATP-binding protein [Terriglobia bacterium]|nr:ABC transporter ATP-binding protein [Terriglobia bacterium]